jgi:hypothetical protein
VAGGPGAGRNRRRIARHLDARRSCIPFVVPGCAWSAEPALGDVLVDPDLLDRVELRPVERVGPALDGGDVVLGLQIAGRDCAGVEDLAVDVAGAGLGRSRDRSRTRDR